MHERELHLIAFIETWHEDSDCITIKRLRGIRLNVLEAVRSVPIDVDVDAVCNIYDRIYRSQQK